MIENFNNLKQGDKVYVLDLHHFTYNESLVAENTDKCIYTQFKDFDKEKIGNKIYYQSIHTDDFYYTISKEELVNELKFLKDRYTNDMQETGFEIKFIEKHQGLEDEDSQSLKRKYDKDKLNIERITQTLSSCLN